MSRGCTASPSHHPVPICPSGASTMQPGLGLGHKTHPRWRHNASILPHCYEWEPEAQNGEGIYPGAHSEFALSEVLLLSGIFSKKCSDSPAYSSPVPAILDPILRGPYPAGRFSLSHVLVTSLHGTPRLIHPRGSHEDQDLVRPFIADPACPAEPGVA